MYSPVNRPVDQASTLQHSDVPRNGRQGHVERCREVGDFLWLARESRQQRTSRAIGERLKHEVETIIDRTLSRAA